METAELTGGYIVIIYIHLHIHDHRVGEMISSAKDHLPTFELATSEN